MNQTHPSATSCKVYAQILGNARALREAACGEFGSMPLSAEGSSLILFLASLTALTSLSTSTVMNVGGSGNISVSAGAATPTNGCGRSS